MEAGGRRRKGIPCASEGISERLSQGVGSSPFARRSFPLPLISRERLAALFDAFPLIFSRPFFDFYLFDFTRAARVLSTAGFKAGPGVGGMRSLEGSIGLQL